MDNRLDADKKDCFVIVDKNNDYTDAQKKEYEYLKKINEQLLNFNISSLEDKETTKLVKQLKEKE